MRDQILKILLGFVFSWFFTGLSVEFREIRSTIRVWQAFLGLPGKPCANEDYCFVKIPQFYYDEIYQLKRWWKLSCFDSRTIIHSEIKLHFPSWIPNQWKCQWKYSASEFFNKYDTEMQSSQGRSRSLESKFSDLQVFVIKPGGLHTLKSNQNNPSDITTVIMFDSLTQNLTALPWASSQQYPWEFSSQISWQTYALDANSSRV